MTTDFQTLNLHPDVMKAILDLDYESPTPIQQSAIPQLMAGHDVLGQAQTGTGKTAAFALPLLHTLESEESSPQALVVTPTRELAIQVAKSIKEYGKHRHVRVQTVYGGQSYNIQINALKRGVDVVVGTPGRILDLIDKHVLDLSQAAYVVLDEADEMLSMGFIDDIESILDQTPETRQTALFSATLPSEIRQLANRYMRKPLTITTTPKQLTVSTIHQRHYLVKNEDKLAVLGRILEVEQVGTALIFTRTRVGAAELAEQLILRGIQAEALHGDLSQSVRETVLGRFRKGKLMVLVATDVAARGLDIDDISHVINYDIPENPEAYIHRIGRTARAGKSGVAITLVTPRDRKRLRDIEVHTRQTIAQHPVPSVEMVKAFREAAFLSKLQTELINNDKNTLHFVGELLDAGYDLQEITAAAIRLARAEENERPIEEVTPIAVKEPRHSNRSQRPTKNSTGKKSTRQSSRFEDGMIRFELNVGKSHSVRPRDIVGAIASEANIPGKAIGAITIKNDHSLVDISNRHAGQAAYMLQKFWIRGHAVQMREVH